MPNSKDYLTDKAALTHPHSVKITSWWREFRTQLHEQAVLKPNLAGHFRVAIWGCGTSCQRFAIIDQKTGKVYPGGISAFGTQSDVSSRLLIINPSPSPEDTMANGKLPPWAPTMYYEWKDATLRPLCKN